MKHFNFFSKYRRILLVALLASCYVFTTQSQENKVEAGGQTEVAATSWVAAPAATESVGDIMVREKQQAFEERLKPQEESGPTQNHRSLLRSSNLPQNPDSLPVAQWPPDLASSPTTNLITNPLADLSELGPSPDAPQTFGLNGVAATLGESGFI